MTHPDDASSTDTRCTDSDSSASNSTFRLVSVLSLILALVFVVTVILAARILILRQVYTDVAMGPVDAPEARSESCSGLTDSLPEQAGGFRRVGVVEPAPDGAAAYRNAEGTELTLRCGVNAPDQYTVLSPVSEEDGVTWLPVADTTEGSSLRTWYSVSAAPVVALTTEADINAEDRQAFTEILSGHTDTAKAPQPHAWPLHQVLSEPGESAAASCRAFLDKLTDTGLTGYKQVSRDTAAAISARFSSMGDAAREPEHSVSFLPLPHGSGDSGAEDSGADGGSAASRSSEPVVVRCGVTLPENYTIGSQLTKVDNVTWFSDAAPARGSTAGVWYAISHQHVVALSMPADAGNEVISQVSTSIAATMDSVEVLSSPSG